MWLGPGAPAAPCHPGRGPSGEQGHLRAALSANIPLFFPLPGTLESAHRAWVVLFSPPFLKKKKNAPVQSFLRLPARGSEDNITYVIYMHIKSLASGCVCRGILCEEREGGGVGEGELGGSALRFTGKLAAVGGRVCACTWPAGPSSQLFCGGSGGAEGRRGGRTPRGVGGEACPARTKWASVLSANLPLDGNFGS